MNEKCVGIFYRADIQESPTKRGFMKVIRLNKLKRKSCPGCNQCEGIEPDMQKRPMSHIMNMDEVKHGRVYSPAMADLTWDSTPDGSAVVVDWRWNLVEVKE